jgi:tRNA pseudouridine38-40 synthase
MARYFLTLAYNGIHFNGWQIQKNTPDTVQQVLEEKLSMIFQEKIAVVGCGRTDTGVNAKNYVAHFDSSNNDFISDKKKWIYKLNTVLPETIAISNIEPVNDNAHARFDAVQRVYHYYISRQKDPFKSVFSWYIYGELDFEMMNLAAATLMGTSDFSSFSKLHTQNKTNICTVTKAVWNRSGTSEWRFTISADRFLRGMVRAIVGTLVMVGRNKITLEDFKNIIDAKDRKLAGNNAPANALFFAGVKYPDELYAGKKGK